MADIVMTAGDPTGTATTEPSFEELAGAVDAAAARVRGLDDDARAAAEDLRHAIEAIHRAGLVSVVRRLRDDPVGLNLLLSLADEPVLRMLFALHGLLGAAPADGSTAGAAHDPGPRRSLPLIPVSRLAPTADPADPGEDDEPEPDGWVKTYPVAELADGSVTPVRLVSRAGVETPAIVVNVGGRFAAYHDECAHQGLPLSGAMLDPSGTLTCPWHGYCFDALSGDCLSAPGMALEPMPLRVEAEAVWIRVEQ